MSDRTNLEVWVAVDENGDYCVRNNKDDAMEAYQEEIGTVGVMLAVYRLMVDVPLPVERTVAVVIGEGSEEEVVVTG
jgi:hypothetical protein